MSSTESAPPAPDGFDRRVSDVNVQSLATGLKALSDHVHEVMAPDQRANTMLTKQVHEAVFGREGDEGIQASVQDLHHAVFGNGDGLPGVQAKVDRMYQHFEVAENAFRFAGKIGTLAMKVSDAVERRPKTTSLGVITSVIGYSMVTTGKVPDWFTAMMKALLA
jgi:hypothetical protein